VEAARRLCLREEGGLVWRSYGGFYFSPGQAVTLDLMLRNLPEDSTERSLCLAALIATASRCAAAPGHTAQPFRPTKAALPFISAAWKKDPLDEAADLLTGLAARFATVPGEAYVGDAVAEAKRLTADDLVILDPPYSAVQYSRFYHVLESIARGEIGPVEGAGRYPPFSERPRSDFSVKSLAETALVDLLKSLADVGCTVVLTFPSAAASNGLSGERVKELAETHFDVVSAKVSMRFSTLGGNNALRPSRHDTHELIVTMRPQ
jgi:adenine-specific DNA-methyltransferase